MFRSVPIKYKLICFCASVYLTAVFIIAAPAAYAHLLEDTNSSFAQEYRELRILLQKVNTEQTAKTYRAAIQEQITRLKQNQVTGEQAFSAMPKAQQELFVKKFQNNRYHCGEVTQVMQERQRILLHPDLSVILRDLLNQIP